MAECILRSERSCDFKKSLLRAVDSALSRLGAPSKQATYFYLERNFNVRKQDIPNKIEEFTVAIEEIFGYGAKILEIDIMKRLYKQIRSTFEFYPEKDDLLFIEYIGATYLHMCSCRS